MLTPETEPPRYGEPSHRRAPSMGRDYGYPPPEDDSRRGCSTERAPSRPRRKRFTSPEENWPLGLRGAPSWALEAAEKRRGREPSRDCDEEPSGGGRRYRRVDSRGRPYGPDNPMTLEQWYSGR
jgi:hypothetical protein